MSGHLGNKEIMAENLQRYMNKYGLDRNDIAEIADVSYFTVTAWLKARTYPRIDKIERLANHWNISKADLVEPESERPKPPTPLVEEITKVTSQLDEVRQQVVLATANVQLKEQNDSKAKVIPMKKKSNVLTDEALQEAVDTAVAFDGIPLNEQEKEAAKALIRRFWEEDHSED